MGRPLCIHIESSKKQERTHVIIICVGPGVGSQVRTEGEEPREHLLQLCNGLLLGRVNEEGAQRHAEHGKDDQAKGEEGEGSEALVGGRAMALRAEEAEEVGRGEGEEEVLAHEEGGEERGAEVGALLLCVFGGWVGKELR